MYEQIELNPKLIDFSTRYQINARNCSVYSDLDAWKLKELGMNSHPDYRKTTHMKPFKKKKTYFKKMVYLDSKLLVWFFFLQGKALGQMLLDFQIKNVPDLKSLIE